MVKINRIYTRTGDDGSTGLVGGTRVLKNSLRVSAYGDIDELNSFVGLARTLAVKAQREPLPDLLEQLQNTLFDLGAELATPPDQNIPGVSIMTSESGAKLEEWIDRLTHGIPELRSFVLPGGSELNGMLHICRSVCRRAERSVLTLSEQEPVGLGARVFLNRLSDLFFAMARYESERSGIPEYLWKAGSALK